MQRRDPSGRRIKKTVDGYATTYLYDGDHIIAEYDGNNNLVRKYVYGPRVDEPVCMIDLADSNAVYYYHFDGLGSVVALTDANGTCVQTYEYTVYGHVAASDPNHPNLFMFTGRQFDIETGLYYYRARYYNPYLGRFLQTDPVGYGDGMNLYRYCMNNPLNVVDPSGLCCDQNDVNDVNDSNDVDCSVYDSSSSFLETDPAGYDAGMSSRRPPPNPPTCYNWCDMVYCRMKSETGCLLECAIPWNPYAQVAATGACLESARMLHLACYMACSTAPVYDHRPGVVFERGRKVAYAVCKAARKKAGGDAWDGVVILIGILTGLTSLLGTVARMWRYTRWKKLRGVQKYCNACACLLFLC